MQQQQSPQMFPMVPSIPPANNITTEQIQKVPSFSPYISPSLLICSTLLRRLLELFCTDKIIGF
ncbi:GIF2 [Arabidopsis thaliana]|uniref:GIF2 n=1 Tax=Arabidopsis thaliana TaxID=3702 RepID=A0A178W4W2_ARATH|nr:GIF2 [Arabidopsis thaliana]